MNTTRGLGALLVLVPASVVAGFMVSCGPRPGAVDPSGEAATVQAGQGASDVALEARAASCSTSDDCQEGLICVDDECLVPVPDGFY